MILTPVKKTIWQHLCEHVQEIAIKILASKRESGAVEKPSHLTKLPIWTIYRIITKAVGQRKTRNERNPLHEKLLRNMIYDKYKKN